MTTVVEPTLSLSAESQVKAIYELVEFGPPPPTSSPFGCCNDKAKTASVPPVAVLGYDLDFHENATMPSYRPATSASASAPLASPPDRWRA